MKIETGRQLAEQCCKAAKEKTLYVFGAFGCPLSEENKQRILGGYAYNRRRDRQEKICSATADTFGFDCSGLIKGVLWGWDGEKSNRYGGAVYGANGVPDQNANSIIGCCKGVSEDFSHVQIGEAVWMPGHIGIYVGDGLVAESSPKWADGVQLTACNCKKEGYHTRNWKKHGMLPYVSYEDGVQVSLPLLYRGMQGAGVKPLQRLLFAMGYPIGANNPIDGSFGPKTEAAVRAFQQEKGLPATGLTDRATWEALMEV